MECDHKYNFNQRAQNKTAIILKFEQVLKFNSTNIAALNEDNFKENYGKSKFQQNINAYAYDINISVAYTSERNISGRPFV
jgi:hypothetical protein